jgi:hypothetical protein
VSGFRCQERKSTRFQAFALKALAGKLVSGVRNGKDKVSGVGFQVSGTNRIKVSASDFDAACHIYSYDKQIFSVCD